MGLDPTWFSGKGLRPRFYLRRLIKQDPREYNYYGNIKVGDFLRGSLSLGCAPTCNAARREATSEGLTARSLIAYFGPLLEWLKTENQGAEGRAVAGW